MKSIRIIITVVLFFICVGLTWYLYNSISERASFLNEIEKVEEHIKQKLVAIREAQKAYYQKYGEYAESWDNLQHFVDAEKLYVTDRKEEIITLDYGADSVVVRVDTIGSSIVKDSLYTQEKYKKYKLNDLSAIPGSDKKFRLMVKNSRFDPKLKVIDVDPMNPERQGGRLDTLQFGSVTKSTLRANWEK